MKKIILTIDGASGVGKSTLAKSLSERYSIPYLNTGAMFRAISLDLAQSFPDIMDYSKITNEHIQKIFTNNPFSFSFNDGLTTLLYKEKTIPTEAYSEDIAAIASQIAPLHFIRSMLLHIQQNIAEDSSLIAEGRDMGSVVFPHATCKFFLQANAKERARRRYQDLKKMNPDISLEEIYAQIQERDQKDTTRAESPLVAPADAYIIDTTDKDISSILQEMSAIIDQKIKR